MDIVQPRDCTAPRPAVLMFHGGGWIGGDRSHMADMANFLASLGYTSATAQYRLATKSGSHYPAQLQDAVAAVKFLKTHANEYGIDPERIAVMGESAGGQIALMVGLATDTSKFGTDDYPGVSAQVAAVVDIYGPTNMPDLVKTGDFVARYVCPIYLDGPPSSNPEKWRDASPTTHVRPDAPPVLIVHGTTDSTVPISQAEQLYKALRELGANCQFARVKGAGHGWGYDLSGNTCMRTLPVIAQFLAENLRPVPPRNQ
jgi:acetyl esterase/lipase